MYDQNFKNQAVKECVNGQSLASTARKYGISTTALRRWINAYKRKMTELSGPTCEPDPERQGPLVSIVDSEVELKSISVNIDGQDITISKRDVIRLMEIFYQFDKQEEKMR